MSSPGVIIDNNDVASIDTVVDSIDTASIEWGPVIGKVVGIVLYLYNFATDIDTIEHHYSNNDIWWGSLTLGFLVSPYAVYCIVLIFNLIDGKAIQRLGVGIKFPVMMRIICSIMVIPISPIIPFCFMVIDLIVFIWGHNEKDRKAQLKDRLLYKKGELVLANQGMKNVMAMGESCPQAILQLYIVFGILGNHGIVEYWLWQTIALSIISIAYSGATCKLKSSHTSKAIYFIFGLLGITSRLVICCSFSIIHFGWLFVVCGTVFAASSLMWFVRRFCCGSHKHQLAKKPHKNKASIPWIIITWFQTAVFNFFTLSGFVLSTINLLFAIVGYVIVQGDDFIDRVPQPIAITALTLASISWFANGMLLLTPIQCLKDMREEWLLSNREEHSEEKEYDLY